MYEINTRSHLSFTGLTEAGAAATLPIGGGQRGRNRERPGARATQAPAGTEPQLSGHHVGDRPRTGSEAMGSREVSSCQGGHDPAVLGLQAEERGRFGRASGPEE